MIERIYENDEGLLRLVQDLVRCKDCIYNTLNTDGVAENWCYKHGIDIEVDDFCSYGERIEE